MLHINIWWENKAKKKNKRSEKSVIQKQTEQGTVETNIVDIKPVVLKPVDQQQTSNNHSEEELFNKYANKYRYKELKEELIVVDTPIPQRIKGWFIRKWKGIKKLFHNIITTILCILHPIKLWRKAKKTELQYQIEQAEANINREKYIYTQSKKDSDDSGLEKLLDLVMNDIEHQYSIKQGIEYKSGFLLTLWGVLAAAVLEQQIYLISLGRLLHDEMNQAQIVYCCITYVGLFFSGGFSLCSIIKTLLKGNYSKCQFYNDRDVLCKCAVEDKSMFLVKLLDSNIVVWNKNEKANEEKYKILKWSIYWTVLFIIFVMLELTVK